MFRAIVSLGLALSFSLHTLQTEAQNRELAPTLADRDQWIEPAKASKAKNLEGIVRLARNLDEPDGYCLDVPGAPGNPIMRIPVWAHTCHMFVESDQQFRLTYKGKRHLSWFDGDGYQCLTAASLKAGARFSFADCDDSIRQAITYTAAMQLQMENSDLCIHVKSFGPGPRQAPSEGEDRFGRGMPINAAMSHLARPLELQPCSSGDPGYSRWLVSK